MKEKCVICGTETEFDQNTPIDQRAPFYVEGAGQLCRNCYANLGKCSERFHLHLRVATCPHCGHANRWEGEVDVMQCAKCKKSFYKDPPQSPA